MDEREAAERQLLISLVDLLDMGEPEGTVRKGLQKAIEAFGALGGSFSLGSLRVTEGELPAQAEAYLAQKAKTIAVHKIEKKDTVLVHVPISLEGVSGYLGLIFPSDYVLGLSTRHLLDLWARALGNVAGLAQKLASMQKTLNQLSLLLEMGRAIASTLDLSRLLEDIMEIATKTLGAAAASLMLTDEQTKELVFEVSRGGGREILRQERIKMDEGIVGWVATHGEPLLINQVSKDRRFSRHVDARTGFLTESVLCVPLELKGKTIGILEVLNKPRGFTEEDLGLLRTLAAQAAVALENANLYRHLQDERDHIIRAQEEVRHELARELHDGTVQRLASLAMGIDHVKKLLGRDPQQAVKELESLHVAVFSAAEEARLLLFELRPVILETQGLVPALEAYMNQLADTEPSFSLDARGFEGRLGLQVEETIFSIVQEAVNNARKHSQAKNVHISLAGEKGKLLVKVEDDGRGFDLARVQKDYTQESHFGLLNMRERAGLIEGELSIDSAPGRGTRVVLRVPLRREGGRGSQAG